VAAHYDRHVRYGGQYLIAPGKPVMTELSLPTLRVTVFSDYICPFCYLGYLRLERLRSRYDLKVNWCLLEIHAEIPPQGGSFAALGYTPERWERLRSDLQVEAEADHVRLGGLHYTANSHKALLLAEAAKEEGAGVFYPLHRRLFEAYLCDGLDIGNARVLDELALAAGAPPQLAARAWGEPRYELKLRHYALAARELGVTATPTFYFDERGLSGLQPLQSLLAAAQTAIDGVSPSGSR
jgi:predicted DsbA family dithiol-disulfide isomerase